MSLEDTELKIGGTSFKGVYIAIVLSLATTLGGGVWTASSLYSRLQDVESRSIPDVKPINEEIRLIQQQLTDNDVSQLKAKLAELSTNLKTIIENQGNLMQLRSEVTNIEKELESMRATVKQAELVAGDLGDINPTIDKLTREIEDLWKGLDYLSNPLR